METLEQSNLGIYCTAFSEIFVNTYDCASCSHCGGTCIK